MEKLFKEILLDINNGDITIHNYYASERFNKFRNILWNDVQKFSQFTPDGRYEDSVFKELNYANKHQLNYNQFLKRVENDLKELSVPCIILLPLNFLNDKDIANDLILSNHIRLFKTDKQKNQMKHFRHMSKKSALEKFFERTVYAQLAREHILLAKDKNFFNYPILTIVVNNIDWRVEIESGKIASAVYAFIRMLEFDTCLDCNGWGYMMHAPHNPARVYGVYYNEVHTSAKPPYNTGYGYSLRFQCTPILDIATREFISETHLAEFTTLLTKFLEYCFKDERQFLQPILTKMKQWQNAILMFNTAYESASIEKYDNALILLLVILESLFISNSGNKKEKVIIALVDFFHGDSEFNESFIRQLVTNAYKTRNRFVHEGIGIDNQYVYLKSIHDYQGAIMGMKPFAHLGLGYTPNYCKELYNLFRLVNRVLRTYSCENT